MNLGFFSWELTAKQNGNTVNVINSPLVADGTDSGDYQHQVRVFPLLHALFASFPAFLLSPLCLDVL